MGNEKIKSMRLNKALLIFGLILYVNVAVEAQNKRYIQAYEAYKAGEYFTAIDMLKDAYVFLILKKK